MAHYIPTIGIECHVQLKTKTKLFTPIANDARDAEPNTLVGPLCFGLPGTLPVLNSQALELAVKAGTALRAKVANYSKFDRKHYFYPDLPKGYQITQFDQPVILDGAVETVLPDGEIKTVRVERAHLEEDAGKSTHPEGADYSLVDLNRSGTPLLEIVSAPDMHNATEAKAYARELYLLMRYADVSEADLYYGNMRFDVNVSVSAEEGKLGTRTETKNLNSFRAVEKAVEFEIARQIEVLERGGEIIQETRGWDDAKQKTFSQRTKEDAHDYRYFPEPDIPPVELSDEYIRSIAGTLPLMPSELRERFTTLNLDRSQVESLLDNPDLSLALAEVIEKHDTVTARTIANWMTGEFARLLTGEEVTNEQVVASIPRLLVLAGMVDGNQLSSTSAKDMLREIAVNYVDPKVYAEEHHLLQVSDESELIVIVEEVLANNQKAADDIRNGEMKAIGFLVGQVMKVTNGSANPGVVANLIKQTLGV